MARKSPAFSFYPNDWLEGTMLMTPLKRAAYIDLMAIQWTKGGFSKDDACMAVRGVSQDDIMAVIGEKFTEIEPNWFVNSRLESEREKQAKRSAKASENGKKGGRPKSESKADEKLNQSQKKAIGKAKPKLGKKLSVLDSVSVSDSVLNSKSVFTSPTPSEVSGFIEEHKKMKPGWPRCNLDADQFVDHYDAQGWIGGNGIPITDWKAMVRKWGNKAPDSSRGDQGGKSQQTMEEFKQATESIAAKRDRQLREAKEESRKERELEEASQ